MLYRIKTNWGLYVISSPSPHSFFPPSGFMLPHWPETKKYDGQSRFHRGGNPKTAGGHGLQKHTSSQGAWSQARLDL